MIPGLQNHKNYRKRLSVGFVVKNPPVNAGDMGLIPGLGGSPGEGNGNPLQFSCLENSMDRRGWTAIIHGITESDMTEQLTLSVWV